MTDRPSRTYLLTGVTGFLGKVVLEELLRRREELGVDRVHLLIRPRGGLGAAERFARGFRARANDLPVLLECGEPTLHVVTTLLELVEAPERGL